MTMICKRGVRITQYIHYQEIAKKVEKLNSIWVPRSLWRRRKGRRKKVKAKTSEKERRKMLKRLVCHKTRPDTRLLKSRAGGQGPYLRSLDHLGRSSEVQK